MPSLKRIYVAAIHAGGRVADRLGILAWLERHRNRRVFLWLHSLPAIYDLDQLIQLDLPWWTFEATTIVEAFLKARPDAQAFEYGSGASTVWLARRAGRVVSAEHDAVWVSSLREYTDTLTHVDLRLIVPQTGSTPSRFGSEKAGWTAFDFEDYVTSIRHAGGPFDLIVIDGRCRSACLDEAVRHLAPDGLIVFDNAGRTRYQEAIETCGLHVEMTKGLTVCLPYPDSTALLVTDPSILPSLDIA